jgi:putative PEP-CTERM system histidine kinase
MLIGLMIGCTLIGIGELRSGFGEFDIYPSGAVIHGSITLIISGGYFLTVGSLAKWLSSVRGILGLPGQALLILVATVSLAILVLSERFQSRLRGFVIRHFSRPAHDYRHIWTDLNHRLSNTTETANLARNAAEVISENFNVMNVSVLGNRSTDGEFEILYSTDERDLNPESVASPLAMDDVMSHTYPFNLEKLHTPWAESVRNRCQSKFQNGGNRIAVPLIAAEHWIGIMILADRIDGVPYTHEELDLLKCIGDQLAAAVLNQSLADELLQAKEMEAFQTLSTFFVHDLKNAANTLSLMLQNLNAHFEDADFRTDAVRGLARTTDRINQLILKLGNLRRDCELQSGRPCRLDTLCTEILETCGGGRVQLDLHPVPSQYLDLEAMRSVITNLINNAREASSPDGTVRIETRCEQEIVSLKIADNGCGMPPDFIKSRLFKPFHTTKSNGLGIGMFQTKRIVEAHGGKISVESAPGKGTTFTILIPIASHSIHESMAS